MILKIGRSFLCALALVGLAACDTVDIPWQWYEQKLFEDQNLAQEFRKNLGPRLDDLGVLEVTLACDGKKLTSTLGVLEDREYVTKERISSTPCSEKGLLVQVTMGRDIYTVKTKHGYEPALVLSEIEQAFKEAFGTLHKTEDATAMVMERAHALRSLELRAIRFTCNDKGVYGFVSVHNNLKKAQHGVTSIPCDSKLPTSQAPMFYVSKDNPDKYKGIVTDNMSIASAKQIFDAYLQSSGLRKTF